MTPFKSLLHFVDESHIDGLSIEDLNDYIKEWKGKSNHPVRDYYTEQEELDQAFADLENNLEAQKLVYRNKAILSFLEDGIVDKNLIPGMKELGDKMGMAWVKSMIIEAFADQLYDNTIKAGYPSIQKLMVLLEPFASLPLEVQDKVESRTERKLKDYIHHFGQSINQELFNASMPYVSGHFVKSFGALPFESAPLLKSYAQQCELLVRTHLDNFEERRLSEKEEETFAKASEIAGSVLEQEDLLEIARKFKKKKNAAENLSGGKLIKYLSFLLAGILILWGGIKVYGIIQDETSTYDERYAEYVKKNNEFLQNRKISEEIIEQRKVSEIVDSYQYGERENVPLFYTYIKTNKYLDINDVDGELFRLKNAINKEGIDTEKIFAKVHFFTTEKDKPYREVLAEYSGLKGTVKYKQVVKPRGSSSFQVKSWEQEPHKVSVEVQESYPSGVMELFLYDFIFDPSQDKVDIYAYTPMPELSSTQDFSTFRQMVLHGSELDDIEVAGMIRLMEELLLDHQYKYRIPHYPGEVSYDVNESAISPMYNWELSTSDDLAFIRIRSDHVKGYYLYDTETGKPIQAKVSYKKQDKVRRSYLVQWIEN